jgi:hypothetical protein
VSSYIIHLTSKITLNPEVKVMPSKKQEAAAGTITACFFFLVTHPRFVLTCPAP